MSDKAPASWAPVMPGREKSQQNARISKCYDKAIRLQFFTSGTVVVCCPQSLLWSSLKFLRLSYLEIFKTDMWALLHLIVSALESVAPFGRVEYLCPFVPHWSARLGSWAVSHCWPDFCTFHWGSWSSGFAHCAVALPVCSRDKSGCLSLWAEVPCRDLLQYISPAQGDWWPPLKSWLL